jgi:hypothetical protein
LVKNLRALSQRVVEGDLIGVQAHRFVLEHRRLETFAIAISSSMTALVSIAWL